MKPLDAMMTMFLQFDDVHEIAIWLSIVQQQITK